MKTRRPPSGRFSWTRRRVLQGLLATAATFPALRGRAQKVGDDVIILGAGLAGLNAALILEEMGYRVRVLEGSKRIGGRLYTASEAEIPGHPELGGSGIGSHYARIIHAAERFGVPLEASRPRTEPRKDELMYHVRGSSILPHEWEQHAANPFKDPLRRKVALNSFQFSVYAADENPLSQGDLQGWQNGQHAAHDVSVYRYLVGKGIPPDAIKLAAGTNMSYGTSPHDLSMLMGFQSSNLVRTFYSGEGALPARSMAGAGGNQQIPLAMAKGIKSEVLLGQHVRSIRSNTNGVEVETTSGTIFRAKFAICTFPFSALRHVDVQPTFEGLQAEAIGALGYTPVFQAHFVPTKPYWEDDNLPPSMWTDRSPGRFMALKNDPAAPDRVTSCMAFVNGQMALYLDDWSQTGQFQQYWRTSGLCDRRRKVRCGWSKPGHGTATRFTVVLTPIGNRVKSPASLRRCANRGIEFTWQANIPPFSIAAWKARWSRASAPHLK